MAATIAVFRMGSNSKRRRNQKPLTLTLSQRERGLTEGFGLAAPTWDIESNSGLKKSKAPHPGPLPEGEGTDRGVWSWYADLVYRIGLRPAKNQKPLTLALSQRERGLTEVFGLAAPTWDTESNSGLKKSKAPHPGPLPEGEGTDRGVWSRNADVAYRAECGSCKDQKPLTLALSRRDRGLTEVVGLATPT
ncbi:hypothetical protein BK674_04110 [Pseudomonas moraviensis]|uniref:Uncharacterized protein n=1 Tax=Pseudomonas moraviensis TaxID=321662 RepID=A0A423NUW0_9PSED|nr:hypothetical protein BK674_04110 [Pseudomonas moraviensis]